MTIALVIAHMNPESAALVLSGLPEDVQRDVAVRVATMDRTSPEIISAVEQTLERRLSSVAQQSDLSSAGGISSLVDLLNRSDRATERLIFEGLDDHDSALADEVRSRMFVFEDIISLDDRSIQQVLRGVDTKELALALKGVRDEVRQRILSNMSSRARETLEEDIVVLGAVRLSAVEEAQGAIVRVIRELEEAGEIVLVRSSEELGADRGGRWRRLACASNEQNPRGSVGNSERNEVHVNVPRPSDKFGQIQCEPLPLRQRERSVEDTTKDRSRQYQAAANTFRRESLN